MKKTIIVLLSIIILCSYFIYRNIFFLQQLRADSNKLKLAYTRYHKNYFESFIKNKKDLDFMLEWSKENDADYNYHFLDLGYNVKYDSLTNSSNIYCFGTDKKDNKMEYTPYNSPSYNKTFLNAVPITNGNYILDFFSNNDIILLNIKNTNIICPSEVSQRKLQELFNGIQLFNGTENLIGTTFSENFKNSLFKFCTKELKTNLNENKNKILVSINRKKEFKILCPQNIKPKEKSVIEEKLLNYFKSNNINYFDYASFPLYLNNIE
ncbi:hypothetical protein [uncultured Maribacter sp.]|uniref:hypothetical protein n=1 Tax=uncultured Maribacter sp. TaxID=431308 RepID=UPI002615F245|nr:hypothetical protein [uncultured Maribacter sp.]